MSGETVILVLEPGEHNWSAYFPEVPGCVATGATREETIAHAKEALAFHLEEAEDIAAFDEALAEEGENVPWEQVKQELEYPPDGGLNRCPVARRAEQEG